MGQQKAAHCKRRERHPGSSFKPVSAATKRSASAEREADRLSSVFDRRAAAAEFLPLPMRAPDGGRLDQPGEALASLSRIQLEERFGYDFSQVRVRHDDAAHRASSALGAHAFTVANNIFFARGAYAPHTSEGQRLLAHELAHVVQQAEERQPLGIQAKLVVEDASAALPGAPPKKNWQEIRDYIGALSSNFDAASSGDITPTSAAVCAAPARTTEQCLCDMSNSGNTWKIKIDDLEWPHTVEADHRVTVPSTRSGISYGAWGGGAQAGKRIEQGNPRVLGHELCGHGWLMERGIHPTGPPPVLVGGQLMGRPSHDPTIAIENKVAQEMDPTAPLRGMFADPHHGESFARITVSGFLISGSDPSVLSADMKARLTRVKDLMLAEPQLRMDVVGHTDLTGTSAENAAVSLARARGVKNFLQGLGVPTARFIKVTGAGSGACPAGVADNPTCRKVEIFMFIFQSSSLKNP
jgi:outer membrane protein OmpA-like peptidoglycan-associated protein